jgi:hypothetical protein
VPATAVNVGAEQLRIQGRSRLDRRQAAAIVTDPAGLGGQVHALVERLHPLRRSTTGDGVRATLDLLAESIPLTVDEIPTSTQVVRVAEPDRVLAELEAHKISADIHYPRPMHQLPAFAHRCSCDGLSNSERFAEKILSLPIFPGITKAQQARATEFLKSNASVNWSGSSS